MRLTLRQTCRVSEKPCLLKSTIHLHMRAQQHWVSLTSAPISAETTRKSGWGRMSRSRGRHGRERLAASAGEGVRTRQRTVCCSGRQRRRAPQGWRVTIKKERRWPSTNGVRGKGNQSRHLGIHLRRSLVGEGTNVHGRGGGPNEKLSHAKFTSCFARLDTRTQRA